MKGGENMTWSKDVFAKNLKYYVEKSGKTQREMADIVGVSAPTFSEWMTGKKYPRIDKIERLASYFGILKSDLIESKSSSPSDTPSNLTSKDERDIAKDLERIMQKLSNEEDGPASFDGEDIPEADREMFAAQVEIMLRRLKGINKELYNPNKNKK